MTNALSPGSTPRGELRLTPSVTRAVALAGHVHCGAVRRNTGEPFLIHVLEVSRTAHEYGASEAEIIAALLHDAVEDGGAHVAPEIRHLFGKEVEAIVLGCTDSLEAPRPDWWTRKRAYVDRLVAGSRSVKLVSGCDKIVNLRSILAEFHIFRDGLWGRFSGGREGLLWYFPAVLQAIREPVPPDLVAELERLVGTLAGLASPTASTGIQVTERL